MEEARQLLLNDDREDFVCAERGFIATLSDPVIRHRNGGIVFDLNSYDYLRASPPPTVNPSLWRHAQLLTMHGLFKVTDRLYQVRGFDVSIISFIDAGEGWIVVDPLNSAEPAKAALELVNKHIGHKPVIAVIYSHSHVDHYAGVGGVTNAADVASGAVQIIAPEGFLEHSVSENLVAGPAMTRRARYQFGLTLPRNPQGEITSGLGPRHTLGSVSLLAPTITVRTTGQEVVIGDLTLVFQVTPGTEAPAEMNFFLPQLQALFMAENANLTMHNLLPARGALVRDAKAWADYLTQAIRLFGAKSEYMFAAHGIPRFGKKAISDFLSNHRDAYKFLHDQSVRLLNDGLTPADIAEVLELPPSLSKQWYNRGYYGTMSHNSKAIYQRYMGWFDCNPANLNPHPPEQLALRYVAAMGGAAPVLKLAKEAQKTDPRWAATLLNNLVFADENNKEAKKLLAKVYTELGQACEAGTWRNIYLTGAQELDQVMKWPPHIPTPDVMQAATVSMLFDIISVRLDPQKAQQKFQLNIEITDTQEVFFISVQNGVLVYEVGVDEKADTTVSCNKADLVAILLGGADPSSKAIKIAGDKQLFHNLIGLIRAPISNFPIVTPTRARL